MKNHFVYFPFTFFLIISCSVFINNDQRIPEINFNTINKIKILKYDSDFKKIISKENELKLFELFFNDSTNYFKSEKVQHNGVKSTYQIKLIGNFETLNLYLHPTPNKNKTEVGYFDPIELKKDKGYKSFYRFYLNSKLIDLIKSN